MRHVHFVGFRGEEFNSAKRIWGPPDFIHKHHDHRMYGDVGEEDVLVFAYKADPDFIVKYPWQDHELW